MFKIEILLSCQSNYSRQCEGKVKKEVVKPRFLLLGDFSTRDNMSPASSRTIGLTRPGSIRSSPRDGLSTPYR